MPSMPGAAADRARRIFACGARLFCALSIVVCVLVPGARAMPTEAMLLDRLCSQSLRANEEDRLYGLISITVRATIKYRGGVFSPDLIDDSVQDSLATILEACPTLAATDPTQRLGMAVGLISDATVKRMQNPRAGYSDRQTDRATAADLSQELSSLEIDAWLNALPARDRALAVFLYASNVTADEMAGAVGMPSTALATAFRGAKNSMLHFFRDEWGSVLPPPIPPGPAMEYQLAGASLADLLKADPTRPAAAPAMRITGISSDIYAGWSLLATVTGLPPERGLDFAGPILVEPNTPGRKRMIVVGVDEIGDPHDTPRRFLLKAFGIDADHDGAGLRDTFRLGPVIDNPQARQTLANRGLTAIETARCLWFDYGTARDPGLCR